MSAKEVMSSLYAGGLTDRETLMRATMQEAGVGREHVAKTYRELFSKADGSSSDYCKPTKIREVNNPCGIPRNKAQLIHDSQARVRYATESFISKMEEGLLYEDHEVRKACKISFGEKDIWENMIAIEPFTDYHGYTEAGMRLWGTLADIEWAVKNITGFRKA